MTKSLPALDARLFDFVAALAVPAAALASRDLATPPLRANPAFAARHGAALLGEMEMFRPGAPLRAALMGDYDAVAAAPAPSARDISIAVMPIR